MNWIILISAIGALLVLLCVILAVANFATENFITSLRKTHSYTARRNVNTFEYVRHINAKFFANKIGVGKAPPHQDCYAQGGIFLSDDTMSSNSLASYAIVAHELGHAKQDRQGNRLKKHWSNIKKGRFFGRLFMPLLIAGGVILALYFFEVFPDLYMLITGATLAGVALLIFFYALALKFQEIKIEDEATDFAYEYLKEILDADEIAVCRDFLTSARLTYWASFLKLMMSWTFLTKKDNLFR